MFDYKLIEALAMVAQEEGFERGAKALFITQSAISQRIKILEELTGQVLIARTTPPKLTPAGSKILKHYRQVKRLEDDLLSEMLTDAEENFASFAIGLNADSLALWFSDAVTPFLQKNQVVLDIRVDDQEQTHQMLRSGEVMGCISTKEQPMQGCKAEYLGCMLYRLLATPKFAGKWFAEGLTADAVNKAPAVIFDRDDELHDKFLRQLLGDLTFSYPIHYVPSSEKFPEIVARGIAYGTIPDQQGQAYLEDNRMVDLAPNHKIKVRLYYHCWSLKSALLQNFSTHLVSAARKLLHQ